MNRKYGRKKAHREHMMRNLLTSLVLYERIDTTEQKAKDVKAAFDQLIARNKSGNLAAIRKIRESLFDNQAAKKVVRELLPRYANRNSGFVKSYHLQNRLGDNAEIIRLELVDQKVFVDDDEAADKGKEKQANKVNTKAEVEQNDRKEQSK